MRTHSIFAAFLFAGCVVTATTTEPVAPTAEVEVAYEEPAPAAEVAYVEPTSYVYVSPEVQVIENYDYPVFFHAGLYYRNEGGVWYSSSYHDRGWVTSVSTPTYIASIREPNVYVHYHANVNARVGEPGYRAPRPPVVNHSGPPPRYVEHPGHPVRGNNVPGRTSHNAAPPRNNVTTHPTSHPTNAQPTHTPATHTTPPPNNGHTTTTPPAKHTPPPPAKNVPAPRPADKNKKK